MENTIEDNYGEAEITKRLMDTNKFNTINTQEKKQNH